MLNKSRNIFMLFLIIFLALDSILFFHNQRLEDEIKIIFFDVGQGDSIMVDAGGRTQIIIDGGDGKQILEKLGNYMPLLDRSIELVIMTHPDKDHMGGLVEILKYYEVKNILETGIECDTAICKEWNKLIVEKNIPVKFAQFGQEIKINNLDIKILYPFDDLNGTKVKDDNESSIVLRVNTDDNSYLLTGDAGFEVENELIKNNINIEVSILKVSHHGSKNSTSNDFLRIVNPEKAVISVGENSYGHPTDEVLNRLQNLNIEFFRTDIDGDLVFD